MKKCKYASSIFIAIGVLGYSVSSASATIVEPHEYAEQDFSSSNYVYGGYMSSTNGQEDLFSTWSSTNNQSFITKEMWVYFNNNEWMEIGDVDGSVNSNYWNGHYVAYQKYNSSTGSYDYHEYTVGSQNPTGTHNFEIQYTGSGWVGYVDYGQVFNFSFPYYYAQGMNVGIESNDTAATFANGTYTTSNEYKDANGTWHYWTTSTPDNTHNNLGWSSTFYTYTNGNNEVTLYN